jgi:hypothetical protein
MRFERAFREARDSGDKTFEFEGKSYSARMAGEGGSSKKSAPLPPTRDIPREDDAPLPPTRDIPRVNDPEKSYKGVDPAPKSRRSMFERMPSPYENDSPDAVKGPEKPPTTGRLRTVGQNMVEKNAGFPVDKATVSKPVEGYEDSYRKGGMVRKKSSGMVSMKSGGAVRGAGTAQRGRGKMRMC